MSAPAFMREVKQKWKQIETTGVKGMGKTKTLWIIWGQRLEFLSTGAIVFLMSRENQQDVLFNEAQHWLSIEFCKSLSSWSPRPDSVPWAPGQQQAWWAPSNSGKFAPTVKLCPLYDSSPIACFLLSRLVIRKKMVPNLRRASVVTSEE